MSQFALVHTSEGKFTRPQKSTDKLRLLSVGHSQKGMNLLDKYKIEYHVVKTYPNGVLVGNVPNHGSRRKRYGSNQPWSPKSWNEKLIKCAAEHVASPHRNQGVPDGQTMYGAFKGVRVGVIKTNGQIATVFPDEHQP